MFPTRDDAGQVQEVYRNDFQDQEYHYGFHREDPNYRGPDDLYTMMNNHILPWPPYEGQEVPVSESDIQEAERQAASAWKPGAEPGPSNRASGRDHGNDSRSNNGRYTRTTKDYREVTTNNSAKATGESRQVPAGSSQRKRPAKVLKELLVEKAEKRRARRGREEEEETANDSRRSKRRRASTMKGTYAETSTDETTTSTTKTSTLSESESDYATTSGITKRKRGSDATYQPPRSAELEPEEEQSEVGADPDTPTNLRPDAPRTPTKRSSADKRRAGATRKTPRTSVTAGRTKRPVEDPEVEPRPRSSRKRKQDLVSNEAEGTRTSGRKRRPTAKAAAAGGDGTNVDPMAAAEALARNGASEARRATNRAKSKDKDANVSNGKALDPEL